MTEALKRALKHEQSLNEAHRERAIELKLAANYAAEEDDN